MFRLRQDQMDVFKANQLQRDARKKAAELRTEFPRVFQFYSDDQLLAWVKRQFARAKAAGITTEATENTLIHLYAIFGEDFDRCDERAWAQGILQAGLEPEQKITLLCDRLLP